MSLKSALLATALAVLPALAAPVMATTLVTSLAAWQAGVTGGVTRTPNPGNYDLSNIFLPNVGTIALGDGGTLGLSAAALVTAPPATPFGSFPYALSDGFAGELFVPQDASGNNVMSETITLGGGVNALGFEVAPYSNAVGAPNFGVAGGPFGVSVTLASGQTQAVSLPGGSFNTGTTQPQFFGFYGGGGIASLTIRVTDPSGLGFGNFVDTLGAPVRTPEPASAALLLVGLTALIGLARNKAGAV